MPIEYVILRMISPFCTTQEKGKELNHREQKKTYPLVANRFPSLASVTGSPRLGIPLFPNMISPFPVNNHSMNWRDARQKNGSTLFDYRRWLGYSIHCSSSSMLSVAHEKEPNWRECVLERGQMERTRRRRWKITDITMTNRMHLLGDRPDWEKLPDMSVIDASQSVTR